MTLSMIAQAPQASASNTASAINYGVDGGTGPTVACDFVVEVGNDGGTIVGKVTVN